MLSKKTFCFCQVREQTLKNVDSEGRLIQAGFHLIVAKLIIYGHFQLFQMITSNDSPNRSLYQPDCAQVSKGLCSGFESVSTTLCNAESTLLF